MRKSGRPRRRTFTARDKLRILAATDRAAAEHQAPRQMLVPGGRGVYAHTILAVSSDSGGPIVLQADSGPIAGDRMMGSFTREQERLVVTVLLTVAFVVTCLVLGRRAMTRLLELGVAPYLLVATINGVMP